ncbi:MAG: transglycosylase SLT domain-containing protein [Candidatus Thioglobus sp.]|nr:MAG: transglycosylase SLT domain-containing protein [Candidatus Thioglobus sp.]
MKKITLFLLPLLLSGCFFSSPAIEVDNICSLMDEKVSWYKAIKATEKKYGAPIYVQLAIIYQESNFASDAKPPRDKLFGIVPWSRPTSAYGYAQVVDGTWDWYKNSTGNSDADRNDFADAVDFIGWYMGQSEKRSGIKKTDAYNQYLAYHEGHGGFNRNNHKHKDWLIKIAKKVGKNAKNYKHQLQKCTAQLDKNSVWSFF